MGPCVEAYCRRKLHVAAGMAVSASDYSVVLSFFEALTATDVCAARVSKLKRGTMLKGLAALSSDVEPQLAQMLNLMDDIQRSFAIIRRELSD